MSNRVKQCQVQHQVTMTMMVTEKQSQQKPIYQLNEILTTLNKHRSYEAKQKKILRTSEWKQPLQLGCNVCTNRRH